MPNAQIVWLKYGSMDMEEVAVTVTGLGGGSSLSTYKYPGEIGKLAEDFCSKNIESLEFHGMDEKKELYIRNEIEMKRKLLGKV